MKELGEVIRTKYSKLKEIQFDGCYTYFLLQDIFSMKQRETSSSCTIERIKMEHSMDIKT